MTILWCMVPEIWSVTDIIFCHFGAFLSFYRINNPKNQNFEKMKTIPGDIIILHKCTKNHDHILYCSWDMPHDKWNHFRLFFALLLPHSPKNHFLKKNDKKTLEISLFYTCVPKIMIRWCTVPEIWHAMDRRTDRRMLYLKTKLIF